MYSFDLKTVNKVVYRRENSSVQAKFHHDELEKIRSGSSSAVPSIDRDRVGSKNLWCTRSCPELKTQAQSDSTSSLSEKISR